MPPLDHLHPPLFPIRRWESFLKAWSVSVCDSLNSSLPDRYFAEVVFHLARHVERDVADVDSSANSTVAIPDVEAFGQCEGGGPQFRFASEVAVEVRDRERDGRLLGVVEFVCRDTKADHALGFAFVCNVITHQSRGVGVLVVDIVTGDRANLHQAWADMTDGPSFPELSSGEANMYAVSYRPRMEGESPVIDVWARPLAVGQPLPELPLGLKGYGCIRVDLDATYAEACERSGLA